MSDLLTRRRFIAALAASIVAVGAPLPIGFPKNYVIYTGIDIIENRIDLTAFYLFQQVEREARELINIDFVKLPLFTSGHKFS